MKFMKFIPTYLQIDVIMFTKLNDLLDFIEYSEHPNFNHKGPGETLIAR